MNWITIAGLAVVCLAGCGKARDKSGPEQANRQTEVEREQRSFEEAAPSGPAAHEKDSDESQFLTVTDAADELAQARQLARDATPKPLAPQSLAGVYGLSLAVLPTNLPPEQAEARLRDVISRKDAPRRAREKAACLLWLMDPPKGQECILQMLREGTRDERLSLLLTLSFMDKEAPTGKSPALVAELLSLMADEAIGEQAVRTCGILRLPGITEALWKELPRAGDKTRSEICFWLARLDPGRKSLDACTSVLPTLSDSERDRCLTALRQFFSLGATNLAQEAAEVAASELLRRLGKGETGICSFPQSECAEVLNHGDGAQVRTLAEAVRTYSKDPYLKRQAYLAMRRWEGPARKREILAGLAQPQQFDFALAAITKFYVRSGDAAIVDALLQATRQRPGTGDQLQLARALLAVGGERVAAEVRAIASRMPDSLRRSLIMELERKPPPEVARQLAESGFFATNRIPELLAVATARAEEMATEAGPAPIGVLELLDAAGLLLTFDVETDEVPVRHDKLLGELATLGGGVFHPEACFERMLRKDAEDFEAPYRVQFIHGPRLYRIEARNFGDWYDLERVVRACNRALADTGERRRFFQLAGDGQCASFVCFTPEQVAILQDVFHVSFQAALDSAMRSGKEFEERARQSIEKK